MRKTLFLYAKNINKNPHKDDIITLFSLFGQHLPEHYFPDLWGMVSHAFHRLKSHEQEEIITYINNLELQDEYLFFGSMYKKFTDYQEFSDFTHNNRHLVKCMRKKKYYDDWFHFMNSS